MSQIEELRRLRELKLQLEQALADLERAALGAPTPRYAESLARARAAVEGVQADLDRVSRQ